jgi:site-specific DNA recombinase
MAQKTVRSVTTIPATINSLNSSLFTQARKRRTAGYARVSTDSDEQVTSYEAQVGYYTDYIKSRDDWEFVDVYTDEGISGTNTKRREGFKRMVADALDGKIDLIVTKSVSRFARNTVDSLTTIRQLKDKGVECYFEKENIWTFDGKGELLLTIMSSLAQEESRSISENVKWGHRKRFADGKVSIPFGQFLGYDRGEDGGLVINKDEAVIVKKIYRLFLEGLTPHTIAKQLTAEKAPTPGGQAKWHPRTISSILTNEKYKGDALLQKCFTVDFLTKKQKINEGEVPQYYVENSHEAIINPQVFELVQQELKRRLQTKGRYSGVDMFSSKIKCGECGCFYGAKVWHSNSKYRRTIYQCNHKFSSNKKCSTPHFTDDEIKQLFVQATNQLLDEKKEIIANLELIRKTVFDNTALEIEQKKLQEELTVLVQVIQNCVDENARIVQDQDEYLKRYNGLVGKYDLLKARFEEVKCKISDNLSRNETTELFIKTLKKQEALIIEFDGVLWGSLLNYITVNSKEDVRFMFKDGTEI